MQAVILVGGFGTRLQALFPAQPKPLVPVAGKPFLEWQIEWLHRTGIRDIHLAAGYRSAQMEAWARTQAGRITVSREPAPLGTAGGLKFAEAFLRSDPFLVLNGDTLLPKLNFRSFEKSAENFQITGKIGAAIAIARIHESGRYGTVEFDEQGRITAFLEKAERREGWVNGGVYLMRKALLESIPTGRKVSIETDIFPRMVEQKTLLAIRTDPPLLDMGTPDGLKAMEAYLLAKV